MLALVRTRCVKALPGPFGPDDRAAARRSSGEIGERINPLDGGRSATGTNGKWNAEIDVDPPLVLMIALRRIIKIPLKDRP